MKDFKQTLTSDIILDISNEIFYKSWNINVDLNYKTLLITSKRKPVIINTDEDAINICGLGFGRIIINNSLFRSNVIASSAVVNVERCRNLNLTIADNIFNGTGVGCKVIKIDSPIDITIGNNKIANFTQSFNTAISVNSYNNEMVIINNSFFNIYGGLENRVFNFNNCRGVFCSKNLMLGCGSDFSNKHNNAICSNNYFNENSYVELFSNYNVESDDFLKSATISVGAGRNSSNIHIF